MDRDNQNHHRPKQVQPNGWAGGYEIVLKPTKGGTKTRVIWMIRKDRKLQYSIRDDLWDHPDRTVLDVAMEDGTVTRIVNWYQQERKGGGGWCMRQLPVRIWCGQRTLIVGEFNAHSNVWNSVVRVSLREAEILESMDSERMAAI